MAIASAHDYVEGCRTRRPGGRAHRRARGSGGDPQKRPLPRLSSSRFSNNEVLGENVRRRTLRILSSGSAERHWYGDQRHTTGPAPQLRSRPGPQLADDRDRMTVGTSKWTDVDHRRRGGHADRVSGATLPKQFVGSSPGVAWSTGRWPSRRAAKRERRGRRGAAEPREAHAPVPSRPTLARPVVDGARWSDSRSAVGGDVAWPHCPVMWASPWCTMPPRPAASSVELFRTGRSPQCDAWSRLCRSRSLPVVDTLRHVEGHAVDRDAARVAVQTPQGFTGDRSLRGAHRLGRRRQPTMQRWSRTRSQPSAVTVVTVPGERWNLKVTEPDRRAPRHRLAPRSAR